MYTPPGLALLWILLVDLAAIGAGAWILRRTRLDAVDETRGERVALSLVTGLAALASVVFALGAARVLYAPVLGVLMLALAAVGARELARVARRDLVEGEDVASLAWRDPGAWACVLVMVVPFLASFEPRLEHDALSYHLELPLTYLRDHGFTAWPWNLYANMPHAFDLLGTLGYAFGGVTGANLIAFHGTFLTVVALFVAARRAGATGFGGALGILYLASPMTQKYWSGTWVEPLLGAWLLWTFVLLQRYVARPSRGAIVLLGLTGGFVATTKHVAVLWLAGLALLVVLAVLRHARDARERRAHVLAAAAAAVLVFSPWAAKAWIATGDPLHPLLHAQVESTGWSAIQAHQQTAFFERPAPYPPDADARRRLLAVPDLVLHPYRRFTHPIAGAIAILWLAAPLVAWGAWCVARRRSQVTPGAAWPANWAGASLWTFVGLAAFACTSLSSFGRYVAGFLGPIVLAAGLAFAPLVRGFLSRAAALFVAGLVFAWSLEAPHLRLDAFTEAGWMRLAEESPTFRVMRRIERELPAGSKVFFVYENRTWPLALPHDDDSVLQAPSSLRRLSGAGDAVAAAAQLRREGFTHVVIDAFNESRVFTNDRSYTLTDPVLYPIEQMQLEKSLVRMLVSTRAVHLFTEGSHEVYALASP